jgi:class 3 adenylate cyclase
MSDRRRFLAKASTAAAAAVTAAIVDAPNVIEDHGPAQFKTRGRPVRVYSVVNG